MAYGLRFQSIRLIQTGRENVNTGNWTAGFWSKVTIEAEPILGTIPRICRRKDDGDGDCEGLHMDIQSKQR